MFDELQLVGSTEKSIVVEARRGSRVLNDIPAPAGEAGRRKYDAFRSTHGKGWVSRKPATDGYNCFGHLFATRRTVIRDDAEVGKVLVDDGYRTLRDGE